MKKAVVFLFAIIFSGSLFGCNLYANTDTYDNVDMSPRQISLSGESTTPVVVENVKGAVVGISCAVYGGYSIGSGVAIRDGGYILTNHHVINGANNIVIYFADRSSSSASVIWKDSSLDLAVIKSEVNMPYLKCAEDSLMVGEDVISIGTPLTLDFKHSVTKGIISALNRTLEVENTNGTISYMQNLIQHDASINPGNSGGPIINNKGEVVGINTLKASDAEGIGFAIPIKVGKSIVDNLSNDNSWTPSYMGIFAVDNEVAQFKGVNLVKTQGVYVAEIDEKCINKDCFYKGDLIVEINGEKINNVLDLRLCLYKYKCGDNLVVKAYRDGELIEIRCNMCNR